MDVGGLSDVGEGLACCSVRDGVGVGVGVEVGDDPDVLSDPDDPDDVDVGRTRK